jgi:hypothetical protein
MDFDAGPDDHRLTGLDASRYWPLHARYLPPYSNLVARKGPLQNSKGTSGIERDQYRPATVLA